MIVGSEHHDLIEEFQMEKLFLITVTFFSIIWSSVSGCYARDAKNVAILSGLGVSSCGKVTEEIKTYPNKARQYKDYIDGFLSGYNLGRPGKADFAEGLDQISQYKFVLKYCEDNPLSTFSEGISKLLLQYNEALF